MFLPTHYYKIPQLKLSQVITFDDYEMAVPLTSSLEFTGGEMPYKRVMLRVLCCPFLNLGKLSYIITVKHF